MKSPRAEGVISILVQIIIYYGLGSWFYHTNFFEGNKVKIYIFKYVWLQAICKSTMAVFKSLVNTIFIYHPGQCYLIRNQADGGI